MNLMDLLDQSGGQKSLASLAGNLGLSGSDTGNLVSALAPALMKGMQKQTESSGGLAALQKALTGGGHQKYLDNPDLMSATEARTDGNNILGHLFGSKDVSRNVAAQAAEKTGIDASLIKKALPMIAGLAMGAVGKKSSTESSGLPGLLGGLMGGGDGDFGLDDVMSLAKKFF